MPSVGGVGGRGGGEWGQSREGGCIICSGGLG